jgi:hypothetical protein
MVSLKIQMWPGRLRGMGREEDCVVSARVSLPESDESSYAKFQIQNPPQDLPDGQYQVSFGGETLQVRRSGRFWLADARF